MVAPALVGAGKSVAAVPVVVIWVESAWLAVDLAESISFWIEVMPWLAAWIACTPFEIPSSRLPRSEERFDRLWAVKKLTGLSRAEETFRPVARRFCVVEVRPAVSCSESRFWRVAAESVMPEDMGRSLWVSMSPFWRWPDPPCRALPRP